MIKTPVIPVHHVLQWVEGVNDSEFRAFVEEQFGRAVAVTFPGDPLAWTWSTPATGVLAAVAELTIGTGQVVSTQFDADYPVAEVGPVYGGRYDYATYGAQTELFLITLV